MLGLLRAALFIHESTLDFIARSNGDSMAMPLEQSTNTKGETSTDINSNPSSIRRSSNDEETIDDDDDDLVFRIIAVRCGRYITKGHIVALVSLVVFFGIALISTITLEASATACSNFRYGFLIAVLADFILVQPLMMVLTVLYRWMTLDDALDTAGRLWRGLHPFDGQYQIKEF